MVKTRIIVAFSWSSFFEETARSWGIPAVYVEMTWTAIL
jgi:predicted metallopeptidase